MKVELFPLQERTMSDFIEHPYENEKIKSTYVILSCIIIIQLILSFSLVFQLFKIL